MIRHLSQCQRKVKGYHTTELFLLALGAYHIHIHTKVLLLRTYVQRKKETCHVGKYLYYLFLFECAKGNCVRVRTTSIITFMCQQLSFVVSFLSWVNEKKQQPTWPLFTRANADKVILFLQKQTSKLMKLKFQLTNIWEECSGNLNNTHSNMAEICTHK